ncbi:MAG TPA: LacI family DNA-binding transcriptional regulator [Pseudolysinimonas sp.]|nr:LacI family DNA-binding transcriptional regulator [Pseudolysinimonas sp.]
MDDQASAPRPTLAAVAARAGVSVSTASLVFSGRGPVAEATRERVLAAASDLHYAGPDPTARSLRRGSTGVIGVVTEDSLADTFRDPMNLALLDGISEGLGDERLGLLVIPRVSDPGIDLAASPVDAAILLGCSTDVAASVTALRQRRVPVVAIEAVPMEGVVAIDLDNRDASRRGAEHLRDLGHRRVAVVTLPLDSARSSGLVTPERLAASSAHTTRERLAGVREVFPDAPAESATGSTVDEGVRVGRRLLDVPATERPTAIVAQSDLLAVGVLRVAEELGLGVPDRLSVVGFDGVRLEGAIDGVLTTLVQPAVEKGRLAAEAVLAALAGREGTPATLHSELRIGTTTAAPAAS